MDVRLAHSADADDVFMWWPVTGKVDPQRPEVVLEKPRLETGRFRFISVPEDIAVLNRRAIERGDLEITAISMATYARVAEKYRLTRCGSSFGEGYGPKLVVRSDGKLDDATGLSLREILLSGGDGPGHGRIRVAVPGLGTSAYVTLCCVLGQRGLLDLIEPIAMAFDRIIEAVVSGRVEMGLIIHEGQLMFAQAGLRLVADMGVMWQAQTDLPLPLGGNAIRRDLDALHGAGTVAEIARLLKMSLEYAIEHRAESMDYARTFSPLKDDASLGRYLDMYVNRWTRDMRGGEGPERGDRGVRAIERLLAMGSQWAGLPAVGAERVDPI
jgi:1,4-dihydroxy-6-naphthoate synthase